MDSANYTASVSSLRRQARFALLLVAMLTASCCMLAGLALVLSTSSQRTVIVPSEIRSEFWVESEQVSRSYYLEWGYYLAQLILNVTPDSANYQHEVLIRHVAGPYREQIRQRLAIAQERMKEEQLGTFFSVSEIYVEPEKGQVAFVGTLSSYVQGRRIEERTAAYMASFQVAGGQLRLKQFVETSPQNAFAIKESV